MLFCSLIVFVPGAVEYGCGLQVGGRVHLYYNNTLYWIFLDVKRKYHGCYVNFALDQFDLHFVSKPVYL